MRTYNGIIYSRPNHKNVNHKYFVLIIHLRMDWAFGIAVFVLTRLSKPN